MKINIANNSQLNKRLEPEKSALFAVPEVDTDADVDHVAKKRRTSFRGPITRSVTRAAAQVEAKKAAEVALKFELAKLKEKSREATSLLAIINRYEKEFEKQLPRGDRSVALFKKVVKHLEKELIVLTGKKSLEAYIKQHPEQAERLREEYVIPETQRLKDSASSRELISFRKAYPDYNRADVLFDLNAKIEELSLRKFVEELYRLYPVGNISLDEMLKNYKNRGVRNITELDLSHKEFPRIPSSIRRFSKLRVLYLSNNKLIEIPGDIWQLSELRALGLDDNNLIEISEDIGKLSKLEKLILNKTKLSEIPESIGKLSNLNTLFLNDNNLEGIPESIGQLSKLREVDLRNNKLTQIHECLGRCSNLKILWVSGNNLSEEEITRFKSRYSHIQVIY